MSPSEAMTPMRKVSGVAFRLPPNKVLGATREHGDRLRFLAGCRCKPCTKAQSDYRHARWLAKKRGDWNGLVPTRKARAHLMKLSQHHVGTVAVAAASNVARRTLKAIRTGQQIHIRALTERRILAVTPAMASDGAIVPATKVRHLIANLLDEGYTKEFIAKCRGTKTLAITRRKRVTVRTAYDIEALHRRLTA